MIIVLKIPHKPNALKADDYESIPQGGASALQRRPLVKEKCEELCCVHAVFVFYDLVV